MRRRRKKNNRTVAGIFSIGLIVVASAMMTMCDSQKSLHQTAPEEIAQAKTLAPVNDNYETSEQYTNPATAAAIDGEIILRRTAYTCSYNPATRQPNYVSWILTPQKTKGTVQRERQFSEDPDLATTQRSTLDDYYHSGYDRGHMCPAADCKWSREAMKQSFYLSNICPQSGSLNGGDWQVLEKACRNWTSSRGDTLYIISGPIFDNPSPRRLNKRVPVPDRFFKTIVCLNQGREYGVGFIYTNNSTDQPMDDCACTIDKIEEITGYDLYSNLPKKQQRELEAQAALP